MSENDPRPPIREGGGETRSGERRGPDPDDSQSLEDLVAGVFGDRARPSHPDDTVMVPPGPVRKPSPAAPAPAPEPEPPKAGAEVPEPAAAAPEAPPPPRRSLLRRLQVSPAVIVASLIAGATGAAADAWFDELAAFIGLLTSDHEDLSAPSVADVPPTDVAPSDFSAEEPAAPAAVPAAEPPATEPAPAPPVAAEVETAEAAGEPDRPPADAAPADRVRLITWDERETGTVVTFWGNGAFLPERVVRFRVAGGRPRELVKLRGIDTPFPQTALELGTPEVERIRTGFHPQGPVNELHMVLDLTGPGVTLDRIEPAGDRLLLYVQRPAVAAPPAETAAR